MSAYRAGTPVKTGQNRPPEPLWGQKGHIGQKGVQMTPQTGVPEAQKGLKSTAGLGSNDPYLGSKGPPDPSWDPQMTPKYTLFGPWAGLGHPPNDPQTGLPDPPV